MEDASASTTYQARGGSVRLGARTTTAPTPTGAEQNQARNGLEGAAHRFAPLWPLILGLAFGRAGLIVASYGSYTSTDEGIFTDGAMLVALVVLALFLVFIVLSKRTISKHVTNVIMRTCVALEAFVLMALAVFDLFGIGDEIERFALSSLCTLVSSGGCAAPAERARPRLPSSCSPRSSSAKWRFICARCCPYSRETSLPPRSCCCNTPA